MAELAPITVQGDPADAAYSPEELAPPAPEPSKLYQTEPGHVALTDERGEVQSIPIENYGKALANGYRHSTQGEFVAARDGTLGTIMSGVSGAARGATFGLSDAATVELGRAFEGDQGAEHVRQGLAEDLEAHPTASMVGEIGGSLLPLALGAPPATAEVEGASALARAGSRFVENAPRLFGEGAAFGAGHQLTEDTLGDPDLVAGKYLTSGIEGGLVNLLLGSALHLGGGAIADKVAAGRRGLRAPPTSFEASLDRAALDADTTRPLATESPIGISRRLTLDPDAGLHAPEGTIAERSIYPTGQTRSASELRRVPLDEIETREPWDPTGKMSILRAKRDAGVELDPVRLVRGPLTPEGAGGKYVIEDGIHRIAVARERGEADILAHASEESLPMRLAGDAFKTGRVAAETNPIHGRFGFNVDPDAGLRGLERELDRSELPIRLSHAAETENDATTGASLLSKLQSEAERQAFKSTGAKMGAIKRLGATADDQGEKIERIGRTLLDEGVVTPTASKADMATRVDAALEKYGSQLGTLRKRLATSAVQPDAENIMRRITQEVIEPLVTKPFGAPKYRSMEPYLDDIAQQLGKKAPDGTIQWGTTFDNLHTLRRALDDELNPKLWQKAPGTAPAAFEELGRVRAILESEYEAAADRAAKQVGEDFSGKYAFAKARYSDLARARDILANESAREVANRSLSLTDTIAAGHGLQAAAIGLMSGHPLAALAAAAPLVNKAVRTYGNQAAAYTLERIAKLEAIQRAASAFDRKLASATKSFFTGEVEARAVPKASRRSVTPEQRAALRKMLSNPSAMTEHVGDAMAQNGLLDAAPKIAAALSGTVLRAAAYANKNMPPEPRAAGVSFTGEAKPRRLGPRSQGELDRAIDALDVDRTLDDLSHRRISRQQVEALKFINPPLFGAIQKSLRNYGQENDPRISVQQEMALSILFQTPISRYTRSSTIRGFQKAFSQTLPDDDPRFSPQQQPGKPIGTGHSDAAESLASPTDLAAANGVL